MKTNNYDFRKSLQLFTFRHKQEEHRAVEEGDHDQAGEVGGGGGDIDLDLDLDLAGGRRR